MKTVSGKEMNSIDRYAIENIGIPGIVLMENAASKLVSHIELYFAQNVHLPKIVLIVAGKGNNAGDAFAAARRLFVSGYQVNIYCLFDSTKLKGDAKTNYDILVNMNMKISAIDNDSQLKQLESDLYRSQLTIDGIFGTGFKGKVDGIIGKTVRLINQMSRYIISIDIASGINSETGEVGSNCIRADKTVSFELPKTGQLIYPGAEYTGELMVESIGMPQKAKDSVETGVELLEPSRIKDLIPKRGAEFNKGSCGKVLILTGSRGMAGAGCIAAKGALKSGAGLVYVAVPENSAVIYQSVVPEAVEMLLKEENGVISDLNAEFIIPKINKCNVAAIGPGLSAGESITALLDKLSEGIEIPVVLDADALNAIALRPEIFKKFKNDVVITPHPGEMARLTGYEINYIQNNRINVAKEFAGKWGITVVLKGARTIIAHKDGRIYINPTGNPGMATAGSGDALTGLTASLIGQGLTAFDAAGAGAFIHGMAGDLAAGIKGQHGLTAMDIVENIPYSIKQLAKTDYTSRIERKDCNNGIQA